MGNAVHAVGALAAGDRATWHSAKQAKEMSRPLLMVRGGLHHRLLVCAEDGALDIVDLVTARASSPPSSYAPSDLAAGSVDRSLQLATRRPGRCALLGRTRLVEQIGGNDRACRSYRAPRTCR